MPESPPPRPHSHAVSSTSRLFGDRNFEEFDLEHDARQEIARRAYDGHSQVILWRAVSVDGRQMENQS